MRKRTEHSSLLLGTGNVIIRVRTDLLPGASARKKMFMHGKFRRYPAAIQLLLLVYLSLVTVQTAHAATSPQNADGLSVDYTGTAAAATLRVRLRDAILGGKLAGSGLSPRRSAPMDLPTGPERRRLIAMAWQSSV